MTLLAIPIERVDPIPEYRGIRSDENGGMYQSRSAWPFDIPSRRAWRWLWQIMPTIHLVTFRNIVRETRGGATSFQWVPPGEVTAIDIRFRRPSIRVRSDSAHRHQVQCEVVAKRPQD